MSYLGLGLLFVAFSLAVALVALLRRPQPRLAASMVVTGAALCVLTVVFDSLMLAADLFRYGPGQLVGVHIWLAPVEDLAWPIAAALLLPSLWSLLTPAPVPQERQVDHVG